jgi:hypothetical protein
VPPRFAYWTILIDNSPTAFRAGEPDELLPTLAQLKRTNENVVLKWFARGRLWESRQEERDDFQQRKQRWSAAGRDGRRDQIERRSKDWRPGGDHKDPRARFDKKKRRDERREQPWPKPDAAAKPWQRKPAHYAKPWQRKPPHDAKPWQRKPAHDAKPWQRKPAHDAKPWQKKPSTGAKPWQGKPSTGARPWQRKSQDRKWQGKPTKSSSTKWPRRKRQPRNDEPQDE